MSAPLGVALGEDTLLPQELLERVVAASVSDARQWARGPALVCRAFRPVAWLTRNVSGTTRVPSAEAPTVARAAALARRRNGLVVVSAGVHRECVRLTANVLVAGEGDSPHDTVIEGKGWEPALVFSGLGAAGQNELQVAAGSTGERAAVVNVTLRTRNALQAYVVYVLLGGKTLSRWVVEGSIYISGGACPSVLRTYVHGSKSCGVKVTDHACGTIHSNVVSRASGHGVLVERGSEVSLESNAIKDCKMQAVADTATCTLRERENTYAAATVRVRVVEQDCRVAASVFANRVTLTSDEEAEMLHGADAPSFIYTTLYSELA